MKKYIKIPISIIFLTLFIKYHNLIFALVNEYPLKTKYDLPDKEFIVRFETDLRPNFIYKVLNYAFPEYQIKYSNDPKEKVNLIIREFNRNKELNFLDELNSKAPYLIINIEPKEFFLSRVRANGLPFFKFVSYYSNKKDEFWLPFIAYSGLEDIDIITKNRQKNLQFKKYNNIAYTHSHCVKKREEFFALLKNEIKDSVDALGKCSNLNKNKAHGDYRNLQDLYKDYKLIFAMENTLKPGYITEKILVAYQAGAIPIFYGESNLAQKLFVKNTYIDINDYKDFAEAALFIKSIITNENLLKKFQQEKFINDSDLAKKLLTINSNKLSTEADEYLIEAAKQLRQAYLLKIKN